MTAPAVLALVAVPVAATAPGEWGQAWVIETDNTGNAIRPVVGLDGAGNAIAVWYQSDGSRFNIYANRYLAGSGWGIPGLIEQDNAGPAQHPALDVDEGGNAIAVWEQSDGTRLNIWSNRYVAGQGWGGAVPIETDNAGPAYSPQVAWDGNGNAIAVWQQSDGSYYNIWSNRFVLGSGWGSAVLIETNNLGSAENPQLAVDASGDAVAVWQQSDTGRYDIWSNRYLAGFGWGTAALIEMDNTGQASAPALGMDGNGNAVAVWQQAGASSYDIWSNRYVVGAGWGSAELVENNGTANAHAPKVACDLSGNAVAVWHQADGIRNNIWSNRFVPGSGWGTPELIEADNAGTAEYPDVDVDGAGNMVAVWTQQGPTSYGILYGIRANRYTVGSGWGSATTIETENVGSAYFPIVSVDRAGNAMAVWYESDGSRTNIWSNGLVEDTPPPLSLSAPVEGASVNRSSVWVAGTTEPGASLEVNGLALSVAADGSFGAFVSLSPGANTLSVRARDDAGNTAGAVRNVTFDDPVPGLEAALAAAQADLAAAQSRVDALSAEGNATDAELAAAKADLASAESRVSTLETQVATQQAALASATASVASLGTSLTTATADLAAAQSRVAALESQTEAMQSESAAAKADAAAADARADEAAASASLGLLVAVVALLAAGAGIALALRPRGAKGGGGAGGEAPPKPPE